MHLKSDFRKRLMRLNREILDILADDNDGCVTVSSSLLPALFSVYSALWCKPFKSLLKP